MVFFLGSFWTGWRIEMMSTVDRLRAGRYYAGTNADTARCKRAPRLAGETAGLC